MHLLFSFFLICFLSMAACAYGAQDLSLDAYFDQIMDTSSDLRAIEFDMQALRMEIDARDLELSGTLDLSLSRFWDNRPSLSSNVQTRGQAAQLGLTQPLATGTTLSLLSEFESSQYRTTPVDEQHLLSWQAGIFQSLWQNRFGRQTALRRSRDENELKSRYLGLLLEQQQLLVVLEWIYWDLAYAWEEIKIREANLQRSQKIFDWTKQRGDRFAAEHVDVLQAQTLVLQRELDLEAAQDRYKTLQARVRERLAFEFEWLAAPEDLKKDRDLLSLPARADFAPLNPVLIESFQAQWQTGFLKTTSQLEADRLKPDLELFYSYGRRGLSPSYARTRSQAFSGKNDYQELGVLFSMPLDFKLITKSREASETRAAAQELRFERLQRQSQIFWTDLERTVGEKKKRVEKFLLLAKLQNEKSNEERLRYEKGRSTAFVAITFEQEAAESELAALQLMWELRRTETQARLYIQKMDVL